MTKKCLGSFNYLFLIGTLLLLAACMHDAQRKETPVAVNGLLDLTQWNFNTNGPVKLSGEWEFYWGKILTEEDLIAEPRPDGMTLIKVPGTWNGHEVRGKKISGSGYATYRLKVLLGPQKSPMAFKFLSMGTAFDLHVNGKEVSSAGVVGTTLETMTPEWLPHTVGYTPESDQLDILLHISNFNHRKGGAVEVIKFGTEKDIRGMRERSLAFDLFLCGSIFIMGLYHLVLFLTRKRDRASLYLSVFCLLIAVYGLLSGERYFTQIFPNTSWEFRVRLTNFTSFMSVPVFLSFIHALFSQEFKRAFLYALGVPLILLTGAVLLTYARIYSYLIPVYHIMTLLSGIYTIYVLTLAVTRKREGSFILLAGTCAIVLTMVNDVLYDNTIIRTGQFIDFGIFIFIFSQSILLSTRFSKAFETVESQTKELTRTNLAFKQEIQMRKAMEEALRESKEKYRLIAENTADLISIVDMNLRFTYISPASMRLRGFTVEESMGQTLDQVLTPESMRLSLTVFEQEMQREAGGTADPNRTRMLELEEYKKDGSTIWAEVNLSFLRDKDGKPVEILIVSRDITDRKRTEEKFRLIAENMSDCIALVDTNGTYQYVSPSHRETLGYGPEDMIGITGFSITNPDDLERITQLYREGFEQGWREANFETTIRHKDGQYIPMEIRVRELKDSQGKLLGGVVTARDITKRLQLERERKQAEEEKRRLKERILRSEKMEALGQLAGGVAHDLNNVLGVLSGYSELLLVETPEGHRSRDYAEQILQSTEKGATIIQDLLTMTRRGVTVSKVLNLNTIVSSFLKTPVFEKMKGYNPHVTFQAECDKNLLNIEGSPVHLEKTLMNLVSNAAESISAKGEVTIQTQSRYIDKAIRGYDEIKEGDYAVLTVSDTGMGISAEHREKIFEPFYTRKAMGRSGTGLGLAIVWGTVKDHNGYIDVQTEMGRGTAFTLYFPVTRKEIEADQAAVPVSAYMGRGESILVVDDVKGQRDLAVAILGKLNYSVTSVASGEEAVAYLQGYKADLLVLDMIMDPGMDGLDTYRNVIKIHPRQKAILVSGFSETDRVSAAQTLGAGAYIRKPYIMEKIGVALRDELDKK